MVLFLVTVVGVVVATVEAPSSGDFIPNLDDYFVITLNG